MVGIELAAYPTLLATSYAVFRLGRHPGARDSRVFMVLRIVFQATLLGILVAVTHRYLLAGRLTLPWGMFTIATAVPSLLGLVALDVHHVTSAPVAAAAQPDAA